MLLGTLVVMVTLAAPPEARSGHREPGSPGGWIAAEEGFRLRLPPGMSHSVSNEDGLRAHVGESAGGDSAVVILAVLSDSGLPCEGGSVEGVAMRGFVTSGGLRACALVPPVDGPGPAHASVLVKSGEVLFVVKAVAPGESARRLAETVADSVRIDPRRLRTASLPRLDVPKAEPRLVGCFEQSSGIGNVYFGSGFTRVTTLRCFEEDLTFTQQTFLASSLAFRDQYGDPDGGSMAQGSSAEKSGTWRYADGVLSLTFDDGTEADWTVEIGEESVLANGKLWSRQ